MASTMGAFWDAVSAGFNALITMVGQFVTALVGDAGALKDLLPVFAIGVSISLILLSVKIIRKITWGA